MTKKRDQRPETGRRTVRLGRGNRPTGIGRDGLFALATTLSAWAVLVYTSAGIPVVWDEVEYLLRAERVGTWLRLVFDTTHPEGGFHAFTESVVLDHWRFIRYSEGHPAWFAFPIALGQALLTGLVDPLAAARIGPITVSSLACGAVAFRLKAVYGTTAALVAPIAILTFPRLFSHAHFATLDGQLTAWWLMLWAADSPNDGRRPATLVGVGVLAGLTSATKFTGWLGWGPVVLVRLFRRDTGWRWFISFLLIGLLTFWLVNPPLWNSPFTGMSEHLSRNLGRVGTDNIAMVFLGETYDTAHSLPWYNSLVWLVLATPLPTLVLGVIGVWWCVVTVAGRRSNGIVGPVARSASAALLLHWCTLMVVRALPGVPPHDGIRLFLPAFGFWCVLAGVGAQRMWDTAVLHSPARAWAVRIVLVIVLAASALNLARYYPQGLSHYSLLAGGVRGAADLGMEPTYWWDAMDDEVLDWLNGHTTSGAAVAFSRISRQNLDQLREWGRLRVRVTSSDDGDFQWYVLQNRPGLFNGVERTLFEDFSPVYAKYPGRHVTRVPSDLRVPLILVYSAAQYVEATVREGGEP